MDRTHGDTPEKRLDNVRRKVIIKAWISCKKLTISHGRFSQNAMTFLNHLPLCTSCHTNLSLRKQWNRHLKVVPRVIEPQTPVKPTNRLDLIMLKIEISDFQILSEAVFVVRFGNHRNPTLRRPPQQNLRRRLSRPGRSLLHNINIPQQRDIVRPLAESRRELFERLRTEGGVRRDGDVEFLREGDEGGLHEVGVVLDLQGGDGVASVGLQVEEGLGLGVGDSDGFCDAGVDGLFERFPGFAQGDVFEGDGGVGCVLPPCLFAREVSSRWSFFNIGFRIDERRTGYFSVSGETYLRAIGK